jgi:LPXTG-motif cell wall-anchored protein
MGEILPVVLGCSLVSLMALPRKWRTVLFPIGCVVLGAVASAVNGELSSSVWPIFVSADALLVWMGAALATSAYWLFRRRRTAG